MRKENYAISILICLLFLSTNSIAMPAASSSISGFIRDAQTGDPLPGANIIIVGTSLGAASDLKGKYLIPKISPGSYTLRVTYIGYKRLEVPIRVRVGQKIKKDFELEYVVVKGQEVVITAQAEGQMAAINQQLSARGIVNVVSSARIQELPDANAAESVGRLPGVSILREGGEGNKVVIRGLSPKYNVVMIEGVRMASTDFNDRSADLSMISPYMLEGIEVMKAITPDQDADALGGSVNFRIREAKKGLRYDLMTQGGYNDLRKSYNDYKLVGSISNRFFNDRLGVFAQLDIENRNRSSNQMGANYGLKGPELNKNNPVYIRGLNLRDVSRDKQRVGGTFVMDYQLPMGKINLKNFFSFSDTKTQNRSESYNIDGNTHGYSVNDSRNKLNVITNVLNYEQNFSLLKIDAKASHTISENKTPNSLSFNFSEPTALTNVNEKVHPTLLPTFAKNSLSTTYLTSIRESDQASKERELAASVNFEMDFQLLKKVSTKIKVGGKYRFKDRLYDSNSAGGTLNLGSGQGTRNAILNAFPWMKETVQSGSANLPYTLFIDHDYNTGEFLGGAYTFGPTTDVDLMHGVLDVVKNSKESEAYRTSPQSSTTNDYSGNEYISAGYIMADLNIGQAIKIIPGVRYEFAKTSYNGVAFDATYPGAGWYKTAERVTAVRKNRFWLPMIHVKYKPAEWFDVRFAYTNTITRPSYRNIIPRSIIGLTSVTWHNYKLKPSQSENYDLYFSIHENKIGLFTFGGFLKQIDDLIFPTGRKVITDPSKYDLELEQKSKYISTQINNKYPVELWGIELDWQTHFWYLPGLLKGLVLNTNYTHIFSEAKYPRTVILSEYIFYPKFEYKQSNVDTFYTSRLLHQPDDIVNVAIGYDHRGFSIRLSMLFQSNIFKGTNFWPELRSNTDDYWRWDLSIKQDLPWHGLQFYWNLNNLTSALDRDLNQRSLFPTAEQYYGRTIDIGLRWRL